MSGGEGLGYSILICDDEDGILEILDLYLSKEGFKIFKAKDGLEGLNILSKGNIDLAVVDIMMPNLDGYNMVKKSREFTDIPIIMLSVKNEDNDKILGLDLGADDYISKPFNPLEVVARVNANLRRVYKYKKTDLNKRNFSTVESDITNIIINDVTLDLDNVNLLVRNEEKSLTSVEFNLIKYLMQNSGRVLTKTQIFENVWGEDYLGDDNIIMVYISKLREKIEENPKKPKYLKTIRGLGYKLEKRVRTDE